MSEEIMAADALVTENAELRKALDISLNQIDAEHDLTKALLIKMRRYFVSHGLLTGECVAWMHLKQRYHIGESEAVDGQWLAAYEKRVNMDALPLVTAQRATPPAGSQRDSPDITNHR